MLVGNYSLVNQLLEHRLPVLVSFNLHSLAWLFNYRYTGEAVNPESKDLIWLESASCVPGTQQALAT